MQYPEMQREPMGVGTLHPEFVPVVFADDRDAAEMYRTMLDRNNIAALVDDPRGDDMYTSLARGIPVLVPEEMHERATALVAADEYAARVLDAVEDEDDEDMYDDEDDEEEEEFEDDEEEDEEFEDDEFEDEEEEEEDDFEEDEFEDEEEEEDEEEDDEEELEEDDDEEEDEDDDDFDDDD